MNKFRISCRVRSTTQGIDATPTEQANTLIEASTLMTALTIWLTDDNHEESWLRPLSRSQRKTPAIPARRG